ncbi:MAG TPA: DNA polymerase III subunit gamma/tau [Steroidobacteraceae bacterium]|nr:DNA polymerase III subunit gamma/tau [Steroidobacteraceae bacterium]
MSSYTALARTWRPRRFSEMTGQEHVLRALANALESGRVHHAFLFAGTRGVGKTTVARILAKCLNCERGVSATPCGECASCREIDAGRSVDLIEVDAASRTRVDDTRELLDNVQYAPTRSRFKIYLIDEVHMLSAHSFNALLKTLEEPPPHVKFLLATTDPQKLPVTVLSRCLQFNLKPLPQALITARLTQILTAEGTEFEPAALALLAHAGQGSLRDALSLLDQLLAYGNGRALEGDARAMLGTVEREHVVRVAELLARADGAVLMEFLRTLEERSPDYAELLQQLAALLERIALKQLVPAYEGDELHPPELLARLAAQIPAEDVQLYYQTAILGRRDLGLAPDAPTGFRMSLIRMLAFRPPGAPDSAAEAVPALPRATRPTAAVALRAADDNARPVASSPSAASTTPSAVAAASGAAGSPPIPSQEEWVALVASLEQGLTRQLAANCVMLGREGITLRLGLDARRISLRTPALEEKLAQALTRALGSAVRVQIDVTEGQPPTLARAQEQGVAARQAEARAAFDADPMVDAFKQRFGASVVPESVRPGEPND